MKVRMLQTVEDANEFPVDEPLAGVIPGVTVGHRSGRWFIARVDKLRVGMTADLPASQAASLVAFGYAEAI